ncbi:hypothetical protein OCK02_21285 [Rhizobium sp. TRM96647]|nr:MULTISPECIES: hypothetical protein [unclassified Rhizobium]MCV3738727.1 hypothetical protein [Rhizobium sp. TRM96647]MCV3760414.1 hypothetical protein [Rhizobium sp. TRM96650]
MKRFTLALLVCAIVAAPCVHDMFSAEPSPLAGLVELSTATGHSRH